ncbi:transmembrane 9 superfamily member 2, partial [Trichonephila clavata]
FDFCTADDYDSPVENLGQVVFGERIRPSPYNISFLKDISCATVCEKTYHMDRKEDVEKLDNLKKGMLKNYQHHWIVDNMPVTWCYLVEVNQQFCSTGFPMGCYVNSAVSLKMLV